MKIIHVIDYISPQLGYQETYLAKEQKKLGHSVTVITSDRYFPFPHYQETVGDILGSRIVGVKEGKEDGIYIKRLPILFEVFTRCWIVGLIEKLTELRPDAIHIHSASSLNAVRIAYARKRFPNTKIICDDHSHYSVISGHWSKKIYYYFFKLFFGKLLSSNIDAFAAITDETKKIMHAILGIQKDIAVIELGADTNIFRFNRRKRINMREKLHISSQDFVIIYAGKIIPDKGVDILVKAFCLLYTHYMKLLIVGNGEEKYTQMLKRRISISEKEGDVIWATMVRPQDLPTYYSAADVGVWPKQESISMIEASSCRLPIIIKNSQSMRSRISNANGEVYNEGNISQLSQKLKKVSLMKRKEIIAMGNRGRQYVVLHHSWQHISEEFIRLYKKV